MGPEAGAGGGRIVVEGPPEDLVIHAARWERAGLLRSHTGEALESFVQSPTDLPPSSGGGATSAPRARSKRRAGTRSPTC
jgi:hypothetical protein